MSVSALASAKMLKVYVKVLKNAYFPNPVIDFVFMLVVVTDIRLNSYLILSISVFHSEVKVELVIFMLKFYMKVLRDHIFQT